MDLLQNETTITGANCVDAIKEKSRHDNTHVHPCKGSNS